MANYDPVTGEITFVSNTLLERLSRMVSDPAGWVKILLPLIILVGIFFAVKKYAKSKKALIIYSVIAVIVYFLLLWFFSMTYFYE
jgi:riboflavin transporter FmnP